MDTLLTVLVCPLDWGIGHATRCVPLIRSLKEGNNRVLLGCSGRSRAFLEVEFPELEIIDLPSYNIRYNKSGSLFFTLFMQVPHILTVLLSEHRLLKKLVIDKKINLIISDNRFGMWSVKAYSVFMTHQLNIRVQGVTRIFLPVIRIINRFIINRFDECWIPDNAGIDNLSGELSHPVPRKGKFQYIGLLSRFDNQETNVEKHRQEAPGVLVMLSGPEPQRSIFENVIMNQLKESSLQATILQGKTEMVSQSLVDGRIRIFSHQSTTEIATLMRLSDFIIARPGYSTLMDLAVLGCKAVFVPTPGQTEQEYLSDRLSNQGRCFSMRQQDFNIFEAVKRSEDFPGFSAIPAGKGYIPRIAAIIHELRNKQ